MFNGAPTIGVKVCHLVAIMHNIDKSCYYNIVQFFLEANQDFSILSLAFVGQLAPHMTLEVDCESLFSQTWHQLKPNRNRKIAETLE